MILAGIIPRITYSHPAVVIPRVVFCIPGTHLGPVRWFSSCLCNEVQYRVPEYEGFPGVRRINSLIAGEVQTQSCTKSRGFATVGGIAYLGCLGAVKGGVRSLGLREIKLGRESSGFIHSNRVLPSARSIVCSRVFIQPLFWLPGLSMDRPISALIDPR